MAVFTYMIANKTHNYSKINHDEEKLKYEIQTLSKQLIAISNQLSNSTIPWHALQEKVQELYIYWSSTILDLNKLDIHKNILTEFGKDIDQLMINLKNRNIEDARISILSLYKAVAIFTDSMEDKITNTLTYTQYYLLYASSFVEQGNWTLVQEYILKSDKQVSKAVNNIENTSYNQYNLYQAYVAIKELENTIYSKDAELFYWKYNIAMDKLNQI